MTVMKLAQLSVYLSAGHNSTLMPLQVFKTLFRLRTIQQGRYFNNYNELIITAY
jgi:hypothetical protein